MGGAASVLSARRGLALAALSASLAAYGAAAEHLWGLPRGWDVVVVALVLFPAAAGVIWLALPLSRAPGLRLGALVALAAGVALALDLVDFDGAFTVAKLACFALVGFTFLRLFEALWWITLIAALVPWVDIWSVATGPTRHVIEERPGLLARLAVASPFPGENVAIYLGPPDVLFFALFLAASVRFGLRLVWTWLAMTGLLGVTLALVVFGDLSGLPALPAVCLGFLLPNADLLWRDARDAYRARAARGGAD